MENNTETKENVGQLITSGEVVKVEAPTRGEAAAKVAELIKQASGQGLEIDRGGFVHHVDGKNFGDPGIFVAELTFIKK